MTTQEIGRAGLTGGRLGDLMDRSPVDTAHTAPAAAIALVLGLVAIAAVPFSLTYGLCVMVAGLGVVCSVIGLAQAHRDGAAGTVLAGGGLLLSLATLTLVALRFTGVETAYGDEAMPQLRSVLVALTDLVPSP